MQIVPEYYFNGFKRQKGQRVVAEYVVLDQGKLDKANIKHFPDISEMSFVQADDTIAQDYMEIMRLCRTHIAHPEIFELCRRIEQLINEVLQDRFVHFGSDRWLFEDEPMSLKAEADKEQHD